MEKTHPEKHGRWCTNQQVDKDYSAARWCSNTAASDRILAAANSQDHLAEGYLSILFDKGCKYFPLDKASAQLYASRAIPWLSAKANGGDQFAEYLLGFCLCDGRGITKNEPEAVKCYERAADQGHAGAQYNLAICYINGIGVTPNEEKASQYYHLAAEQGHAAAQNNLGYCYEIGNGSADHKELRRSDTSSSQEPPAVSRRFFFSCCTAGVPVNDGYHQLASDHGHVHPHEMEPPGLAYRNGIGVAGDAQMAIRYYTLAAEQGHSIALYNLGRCHKNGTGVKKSDSEALRFFRLSADQGLDEAQFMVGFHYLNGISVNVNKEEAIKYYKLAASQGHPKARMALERIEKESHSIWGWLS